MGNSTQASVLQSRSTVVNDILIDLLVREGLVIGGRRLQKSPTGYRESIEKAIWRYGEPHGGSRKKTMCPVMTRQALRLINAQDGKEPAGEQATVEHLVPRKVVLEALLSLPPDQHTAEVVQGILDRLTLTAIVTRGEDRLLKKHRLNSKMPTGWCPETGCPLERYRVAGLLDELVVIGPLEGVLTPPMAVLLCSFPRHPSLVITKKR